jgi:hypothetical protein
MIGVALSAAVAAGMFYGTWMAWTGRWRRWASDTSWFAAPLHLFPSLALGAALPTLSMLFGDGLFEWVATPVIVAMFGLVLLYLIGVFFRAPKWSTPKWYRDHKYDSRDDQAALALAWLFESGAGEPQGGVFDSEEFDRSFVGQEVSFAWMANWVHDPAAVERDHALAGAGSAAGHLSGSPNGIAFIASPREQNVRGVVGDRREFSFLAEKPELLATSTVRAGADGQGRRPAGQRLGRYNAFRRLVVHTSRGDLVFETWFARRRADELAAMYGIDRRPDL